MCCAVSARGLSLFGDRAGQPPLRLVDPSQARPDEPIAIIDGFNVHAARTLHWADNARDIPPPRMPRDEFFAVLDELAVTRGIRMSLPTCDDRLIGLPVAEGGELLCFLPEGVLSYVEYQGDIFLEAE